MGTFPQAVEEKRVAKKEDYMSSVNYQRAQTMVLCDKYNLNKTQFYEDLTRLAKKYFELECILATLECDKNLQVTITLNVKKVKPQCRPLE